MNPGTAPRVSVVVPTYASGVELDRLVRSLEAQTMPASDFEVIFVDDGSPDQTWARLEGIRSAHDNVRIKRIENSGWPSRPRNVGLEMARGEYVLFMDHDDELYPRALAAGYALAARTSADVVNGKETRTDQPKWAIEVYERNLDNAIDRLDVHPLHPTNPHKLFRRQFLLDHHIRFPEGRRVLWEDVFFALDVARHVQVISVLADTPFYHWIRTTAPSASASFATDPVEYWTWLGRVVEQTNEKLRSPDLYNQWRLMLLFQYEHRVLAAIKPALFESNPEQLSAIRNIIEEMVTDQVPVEIDALLPPIARGKAALARAGRFDLLKKLVNTDVDVVGLSKATSLRWRKGKLKISAQSRWSTLKGDQLALRWDGDRVLRDLPSDVEEALPFEAIDMTSALWAARTAICVRGREEAVTWMLPGTSVANMEDVGGRPELVVTATAELNPNTAAFGAPLDEPSWDLTAHNELAGIVNQRGLRSSVGARTALVDGRAYIAYRSKTGMCSLDIGQKHRSLTGSAKLDPTRASVANRDPKKWPWRRREAAHRVSFELPFTGIATSDDSVIDGLATVGPGPARPARIAAREDGAWLVSSLEQPPGTYPLVLHLDGRDFETGVIVSLDAQGGASFSRPTAADAP